MIPPATESENHSNKLIAQNKRGKHSKFKFYKFLNSVISVVKIFIECLFQCTIS